MQLPKSCGAQGLHHQLHFASGLVHRDTRLRLDQLPISRHKIQLLRSAAKQGAANLRAAVF